MQSGVASDPSQKKRALLFGALCWGALAGCGFHGEPAALAQLRSRIRTELGTNASVNVRSAYGSTTVTVRLEHLPLGDPKLVQSRVEALAKEEFPKTEYVVVLTKF